MGDLERQAKSMTREEMMMGVGEMAFVREEVQSLITMFKPAGTGMNMKQWKVRINSVWFGGTSRR